MSRVCVNAIQAREFHLPDTSNWWFEHVQPGPESFLTLPGPLVIAQYEEQYYLDEHLLRELKTYCSHMKPSAGPSYNFVTECESDAHLESLKALIRYTLSHSV